LVAGSLPVETLDARRRAQCASPAFPETSEPGLILQTRGRKFRGNEEVSGRAAERAVRLYRESDPKPVIRRLVEQLNVHPVALRNWIRQAEADHI
jgi:hypothetical protein